MNQTAAAGADVVAQHTHIEINTLAAPRCGHGHWTMQNGDGAPTRPPPRATSPSLTRHPLRSIPESALLRTCLPRYPHAQGVSPTLSRCNQPHRRPPHERPVEPRAICARHHEALAQENHPSFAQILADMLDIVVATQASAPAAISMGPWPDQPMVVPFPRSVKNTGPSVLDMRSGTVASSLTTA